jgi:hypothetical protein
MELHAILLAEAGLVAKSESLLPAAWCVIKRISAALAPRFSFQ